MASPTVLAWGPPMPFPSDKRPQRTEYSPQAFGLEDRFYVVWVKENKLMWSYQEDGGQWADTKFVQGNTEADLVRSSPCVSILNGKAHIIYGASPNISSKDPVQLVHLQLDTETRTWGRRCGVLAQTSPSSPQALASFQGVLYCVYRDAITSSMRMVQWTEHDGWAKSAEMRGVPVTETEPALFELHNALRLLIVDGAGAENGKIRHYSYDSGSWNNEDFPNWISVAGITAESVNDKVFAAFCLSGEMVTVQYNGGSWTKVQPSTDAPRETTKINIRTPTIAVVGNQVICIRATNVNGDMSYLKRRVLAMPTLDSWMDHLEPQLKVAALTIPGTHDAAAISNVPFTTTQEIAIPALLNSGIRYFDIRAAFPFWSSGDDLVLVHSRVTIHTDNFLTRMQLTDVFQQFYDFLNAHPTEGLLVQIKLDVTYGESTDTKFAKRIAAMILADPGYWLTTSKIPTVNELRGKIQLIRRFVIPSAAEITQDLGIDVSQGWLDNGKNISIAVPSVSQFKVLIQDYYTPEPNATLTLAEVKWVAILDHMARAISGKENDLYLNFASATNWRSGWTPWIFAAGEFAAREWGSGVNHRLRTYFNARQNAGRFGIMLVDYPGIPEELILSIVKSNFADLY